MAQRLSDAKKTAQLTMIRRNSHYTQTCESEVQVGSCHVEEFFTEEKQNRRLLTDVWKHSGKVAVNVWTTSTEKYLIITEYKWKQFTMQLFNNWKLEVSRLPYEKSLLDQCVAVFTHALEYSVSNCLASRCVWLGRYCQRVNQRLRMSFSDVHQQLDN